MGTASNETVINTAVGAGSATTNIGMGVTLAEVVEETEPIYVSATMQIVIPTPNESMHLMHKSLVGIQQTISEQHVEITDLLSIVNTSLYYRTQSPSLKSDTEIVEILDEMSRKMDAIAGVFASLPEWIPAHTLQESTGLSVDAIRNQLLNPKNFEPEVDYKQVGKIWHINKNAIPKVRRQK
jgi:hypothetical protein